MRSVPLALLIFLCTIAAFASEIREFDVKTLERLGNELTRVSQTPERGATTSERKRAKQTAIAALRGKLYNAHYDYAVLDDPHGNGFLVYALAVSGDRNNFSVGGHVRVTTSADGSKVRRIEDLGPLLPNKLPPGGTMRVIGTVQAIDNNIPVETWIYSSNLYGIPIGVGTPDGNIWMVENGKIEKTGEKTKGFKRAGRKK